MSEQAASGGRFQEIDAMLADLRLGFEADGYELRLDSVEADHAALSIVAGPEACEECLVPKSAMQGIVLQSLSGSGISRVSLTYPTEAEGSATSH